MSKELFFEQIRTYYPVSEAAASAWGALLRKRYTIKDRI